MPKLPNSGVSDVAHMPGRRWFRDCRDEICETLPGGAVIVIASVNPMAEMNDACAEESGRLIAAAPVMLKALQAAEDKHLRGTLNMTAEEAERVTVLRRQAISLATKGEESGE